MSSMDLTSARTDSLDLGKREVSRPRVGLPACCKGAFLDVTIVVRVMSQEYCGRGLARSRSGFLAWRTPRR